MGTSISLKKMRLKATSLKSGAMTSTILISALSVLEENINRARLSEMTKALAEFALNNSDCNFQALRQEIKAILTEVAEADGLLDEREEMVIEHINKSLEEHATLAKSASRAISSTVTSVSELAGGTARWHAVDI